MAKRAKVVETEVLVSGSDVDKLHYYLDRVKEFTLLEEGLKARFRLQFPTGGTLKGTDGRHVVVEQQSRRELRKLAVILDLLQLFQKKKLSAAKMAECLKVNAEKLEKATSVSFVEQHVSSRKKVLAVKVGKDK